MITIEAPYLNRLENAALLIEPFLSAEASERVRALLDSMNSNGGLEEEELLELLALIRQIEKSTAGLGQDTEEAKAPKSEKGKRQERMPESVLMQTCQRLASMIDFLYRNQKNTALQRSRKHHLNRR